MDNLTLLSSNTLEATIFDQAAAMQFKCDL